MLQKEIEDGAAFDMALLPRPELDALAQAGKIAAGTHRRRDALGGRLAVRAGAPKPDIGTVEASSARCWPRSRSPIATARAAPISRDLLERLGIAEAMKPKTKLTSRPVAELVAAGEAEIGMQQIVAILPVKGAELVGPLPSELQNVIIYAAGLAAGARNRGAAATCIAFMATAGGGASDPGEGHGAGLIGCRQMSQMCLRHRTFMPISA